MRDRRKLGFTHRGGEAHHPVIAGVHLEQQGGLRAGGGLVVPEVGAVGGAHLAEDGSAAGHHLGDVDALGAGLAVAAAGAEAGAIATGL